VLALVGPTASGKTELAVDVAERVGGEVVCCDAFTVYRGMDAGTAKPSAAARRRVPHHMVDVCDPAEDCTVSWFQGAARAAIRGVHERGRPAVLTGGSGLYFRAVVDPLRFPPTDPEVREQVVERVAGDAAAALDELAVRDPEAASRIPAGNLRRAVRALEVCDLTGRPFSAWRTDWDHYAPVYPALTVVGIDRARDELRARIAARARRMVSGGLLDEARGLMGRRLSQTAEAAIGYREAFACLRGELTTDETVEAISVRTRKFAVRQLAWFRRDPRVEWHPAHDATEVLARGQ